MNDPAQLNWLVPLCAFLLAAVFGAVALRVNFCTMGAVTDVVNFGDWRRMRMWLLAIAVAIAGTGGLAAAGLIDLGKSIYVGPRVPWLSHLIGGFLFGFGMTLGSGCGSKTLIRVAAGNLKSLVVLLVLGISAYMTMRGAFAPMRAFGLDTVVLDLSKTGAHSDLATLAASAGLGSGARRWVPFVVAAVLAAFVFANRDFRGTREMIVGGVLIGAVIVGGWYVSGHLGYLAEDPATLEEKFVRTNSGRMESFSYVAPLAYLIELLILWTDQSRVVTFGIAGVLGMLVGATAMALATRSFRWEGFASVEDVGNHLLGALLMGFGGVTALGCTIGQGLTGISTLAVGSILTFFSIVGGCMAAVRYQMWRIERSA
jgi:uncharacterized membrane protein YedE/YeeE